MAEEKTAPEGVTLREIAVRLTGLAHASLVGRLRAGELIAELRAIADWIEGGTKPAKAPTEEVTTQVEIEIFEYWRTVFGKTRAKFGPDRRRVVRARLREGYTPADIRRAIDGCKASDFHSGVNEGGTEYNDLTLICRNGSKLERFRDIAKEHGAKPLAVNAGEETSAELQRLIEDAQAFLKNGDTNAYNRTEAKIEELRKRGGDAAAGRRSA